MKKRLTTEEWFTKKRISGMIICYAVAVMASAVAILMAGWYGIAVYTCGICAFAMFAKAWAEMEYIAGEEEEMADGQTKENPEYNPA